MGTEHFPGYDVVDRADMWDSVTRDVVLRRAGARSELRFFTTDEARVARPLLHALLALEEGPAVPVLELIDTRLADGETDGWRHDDLPHDADAWRRSLQLLDADARDRWQQTFDALTDRQRHGVLEAIRTAEQWRDLPAAHLWDLWMRYACAALYSHPEAWNEMGFGGPAYPVGYANLGLDRREHWEVTEHDAHDPEPWAHRVEQALKRHGGAAP